MGWTCSLHLTDKKYIQNSDELSDHMEEKGGGRLYPN